MISVDGSSGAVVLGELTARGRGARPRVRRDPGLGRRGPRGRLGVRANADNGPDAARARDFGAEGIGLCRTEHMFLGRAPAGRAAAPSWPTAPRTSSAALAELGRVQQADFEEILEAMDGLPVTVRLLDPPLHEFLPSIDEAVAAEAARGAGSTRRPGRCTTRPAPGGSRTRCSARAASASASCGPGCTACRCGRWHGRRWPGWRPAATPVVEIMIPLTVVRRRAGIARAMVEEELAAVRAEVEGDGSPAPCRTSHIGTMIETPRAALRADDIAPVADFFSFGTNDLTQMTFGFSRDDVEGRIIVPLPRAGAAAPQPLRDARRGRRGRARPPRHRTGPPGQPGPEGGRVRRARRRPRVDRVVLVGRGRLRVLLALPGADRPAGGRPGHPPAAAGAG